MYPDLISSDAVAVTDMEVCEVCGTCVGRCHFGAREVTNNKLKVDPDLCYGCGVCISTCTTSAITLEYKS